MDSVDFVYEYDNYFQLTSLQYYFVKMKDDMNQSDDTNSKYIMLNLPKHISNYSTILWNLFFESDHSTSDIQRFFSW